MRYDPFLSQSPAASRREKRFSPWRAPRNSHTPDLSVFSNRDQPNMFLITMPGPGDLLKMHLNLLFQALFLLASTPKLLFPNFFLFFFLWRRGQHQLLILREVLFGHDILEEHECLDHVFRRLSTNRRSRGGGSPTPAPGGLTCGLLLVVGGTELGPFGGARPKGPLGPFPFLSWKGMGSACRGVPHR